MIAVRTGTPEDLAFFKTCYAQLDRAMVRLLGELVSVPPGTEFPHTDAYWQELLSGKTGLLLAAHADGHPAGMAIVRWTGGETAHFEDLYVLPQFRQQGIGTALLTAVKSEVRKRGCRKLTLNVLPNNEAARRLYRTQGFQEVRVRMECDV